MKISADWTEYQLRLKRYVDRSGKLEDNLQQAYDIIIGQCSPTMEQALTSDKGFTSIEENADAATLLKFTEQICYNFQPHEYPPLSDWKAIDKLSRVIQPKHISKVR